MNSEILRTEAKRKGNKAHILAHQVSLQVASDVVKKLEKHQVSILNLENLKWATGRKYGSKWTHSQQQQALEHTCTRAGIRLRKVSPKDTSQKCHKRGCRIIHNSKHRTAWCTECKLTMDRDFNAAMNIVKYSFPIR